MPRTHPIFRVIEELEPHVPFTAVNRRMLEFKRCGVEEYGMVDTEEKQIHVVNLNSFRSNNDIRVPSDFQQMVAEFFGTDGL
jgi:hypothetical protein